MTASSPRFVAYATVIAFTLALVSPSAHAGLIPTQQALAGSSVDPARDRVATALGRSDVQAQLTARGVDPAVVAERVAALTDAEVAMLDSRIDQLPAGGELIGTLVFIFIVLLITDLIGWTHVFPFTNKGSVGK